MARVREQSHKRVGDDADERRDTEQQSDFSVRQREIITQVRNDGALQSVDQFVEKFNGVKNKDGK